MSGCGTPDHPIVRAMEQTGYPGGKEPRFPRCPVCGEECETVFRDRCGVFIGCDICVELEDAWEVSDCFPKEER